MRAVQITGPDQSVEMVRSVIRGDSGPARDIVILNAAAGLLLGGAVPSPCEAVARAAEVIDRQLVSKLLEQLVRVSYEPVN